MSRLVARILLSMFMFPLGVMLYALTTGIAESALRGTAFPARGEEAMFLAADVVTWAGVAAYWCLLWRGSVQWSPARVSGTAAAAVAAVVVGGAVAAVISAAFVGGSEKVGFILFLGGVLAILLWLVATIFLWRETAAERAARVGAGGGSSVACPTCGYNLTGLAEARCPECGSRFTLDELLAAQPARVAGAELA